jgi:hypothetical protein
VRLEVGDRVIEDFALVDTGADSSAFPLWMMSRFGVAREDCEAVEFESAAGPGKQWIWSSPITAVILDRRLSLKPVFADTPTTLLGREDFLGEFKVSFDQRASSFTLEPY